MDASQKTTATVSLDEDFVNGITTVDLNSAVLPDTISITGSPGAVYSISSSGLNGLWNTNNTTGGTIDWGTLSTTGMTSSISQSGTIELQGENADIKVNGRSLMDAVAALEQRLNILVPNPELEAEWDELRELGDRYRELEKKCKEKGEMWNKLKSMPPKDTK